MEVNRESLNDLCASMFSTLDDAIKEMEAVPSLFMQRSMLTQISVCLLENPLPRGDLSWSYSNIGSLPP